MSKVPTKWTPEVAAKFLGSLATLGLPMRACAVAGISYTTYKRHMASDDDFATAVEDANRVFNETLEEEVHRRGFKGWKEPVFGKDGKLGSKMKYSDALALAHIKKRDPSYRDRPIDLNINKGGVLVIGATPANEDEWRETNEKTPDTNE